MVRDSGTRSRGRRAAALLGLGLGLLILAALLHAPPPGASSDAAGAGSVPEGWRAAVLLLGGFRPLALDLMWLRADALHRRGRLWELAALFRGITALDPGNATVREFAAWHMAYNVVLAEGDPDRRFRWFAEAVETLRGGLSGGREAWRLRTFGGTLFLDRLDAGVIPEFAARVEAAYGAPPEETAAAWLEAAAAEEDSKAAAHAWLLGCLARLQASAAARGDRGVRARWAAASSKALARAKARFPAEDWGFAEGGA